MARSVGLLFSQFGFVRRSEWLLFIFSGSLWGLVISGAWLCAPYSEAVSLDSRRSLIHERHCDTGDVSSGCFSQSHDFLGINVFQIMVNCSYNFTLLPCIPK